jgi:serine/threonine protein kinase
MEGKSLSNGQHPRHSIIKKYSTASDVWSYGCVLYEIWSLGHIPFEDLSNAEVNIRNKH